MHDKQNGEKSYPLLNDVVCVMQRLIDGGHACYVVGGAVRDALLGSVPTDVDVATSAHPNDILRELGDTYKVLKTGLKHGTVTVVCASRHIEVTSFRTEGTYSDRRRPDQVTFDASFESDMQRRDFTINAMALDIDGHLIDLVDGKRDVKARIIRAVGSPEDRFSEDALRVLRALRLAATLDFRIETATKKALLSQKEGLLAIAAERVYNELTRMLVGRAANRVIKDYLAVLAVVIPELAPLKDFDQKNPYHDKDVLNHTCAVVANVPPVPHLRWAALLHDVGKASTFSVDEKNVGHFYGHAAKGAKLAEAIMRRLKADTTTRQRVTTLVYRHDIALLPEEKMLKRRLRQFGPAMMHDLLCLKKADLLGQSEKGRARADKIDTIEKLVDDIIKKSQCFCLEDLAISGHDLIAIGYENGPIIGKMLEALLDDVIEGRCANEKDELLRRAKK